MSTRSKTCSARRPIRAELIKKKYACTVVPLSVAPSNYYIDVWSPEVPELDLYSALNGTVPEGQ